jgi:Xaa-Pro aminopeptidase
VGWVVFPLDGPVVLVADAGDRGRGAGGSWADVTKRADDGLWSPGIIEALRGAKLDRARLGVGRLHGVQRNLEGDVSATTLERVRAALPRASLASAADLLMRVKLARSAEEIAVLEQATAAGERAIEVLVRGARPGRRHLEVWSEVFAALTGATGEPPARLALRAGEEANTSGGQPLPERLQAGQILNQEIAGQVLGHMAQVNHSFVVGGPPPADWTAAARYCADVFDELLAAIRPGKPFLEICRLYAQRAQARSPEMEPRWVLVHTCGLGDGPRMGLRREEARDLVIEPGMVFDVKPRILVKNARPTAQYGDPVVVTETGARRLGRRRLGPEAG